MWMLRWLVVAMMVTWIGAAPQSLSPDYTDYKINQPTSYDEYPIVVPKRAALLLDKIMVALQKAVDDDKSLAKSRPLIPVEETMDLQRRGNSKSGRIYWRCYFNAVTCF